MFLVTNFYKLKVYGVGKTERLAKVQASSELEPDEMIVLPTTQKFAEDYKLYGGSVRWEEVDGKALALSETRPFSHVYEYPF